MKIFLRTSVILVTLACAAITANAQIANAGFESQQSTNTIFTDSAGNIVTNREPFLWSVSNLGFRTATNGPANGQYQDPDYFYVHSGINSSAAPITARSGRFSARVLGPFDLLCCGKSSLNQVVTNQPGQVVSNSAIWVANGYALNWSGDPLTNAEFSGVSEGENFGLIQIEWFNSAGGSLGEVDGPKLYTNTVMDTWISCSVTATAPFGATYFKVHAAHVGRAGALGSIFWDDVSVTNIGFAPPPSRPPLEPAGIQAGAQVCWPTSVGTSYQPQYSDNGSTWVNIISSNAAQQLLPGDGNSNCVFSTNRKFFRVVQSTGTDASLVNSDFETPGPNYIYDNITNTSANGWTQFNYGYRIGTNAAPAGTGFGITGHNGSEYSLKTYGPYGNDLGASGAYQDLTASAGQNWRLTGYCLNWQNDKLNGSNGFGVGQLQFMDNAGGTGDVLQVVEGSRFGTDVPAPLDAWQFFEVDATNAPAGTTKVRAQVMHVGMIGNNGALFWDDLKIYQPIGAASTITPASQPAVQIYWPTAPPSNGINYQVQASTNINFPAPVRTGNVLVNGGFETDAVSNAVDTTTITGWSNANGGSKTVSSYPNPTYSGIGALRLRDTTTQVPVVWQGLAADTNPHPVTPGEVWDLSGFAYVSSEDSALQGNAFGSLKLIWANGSGAPIQCVSPDTNGIGTIVTGTYPGIESQHITGAGLNRWFFIQARGTVPAGASYAQAMALMVGFPPGGAIRFDDLVLTTNLYVIPVQNLGPVYPGTGNTNTLVSDPIGSNTQKFYRVYTP